jgi:hypothetical protein
MNNILSDKGTCCGNEKSPCVCGTEFDLQPLALETGNTISCCGSSTKPEGTLDERPGKPYRHFDDGFVKTPAGPVPGIKTVRARQDVIAAVKFRMGIKRDDYRVAPGLYCVGNPGPESPVLVTANYKLSFGTLCKELTL